MAAAGTRSAMKRLSQPPVILLTSSSGGDSEDSDSDLSGDREINPLPTKRQRKEVISGGNGKLLSDGFLDPLPPPKPSKVSPMLSCKKDEHTKWNDTKTYFLLKLLEDYNEPKWRRRVKWANGVWEMIFQDFKKRFRNANVCKSQLQDRAYKMKQTYKLLKKLSQTSWLRWDHTSNMLQGPENAWSTLMRTNKDAKQWYNKPWPYYSICQRLFEGKSTVENQSTISQSAKTSQPCVAVQVIEEVMMHSRSDFDDPTSQISSQKKDRTFQVTSGSFTTSTGKPSSNLKLIREFPDMKSEREFSIKNCMEAFYKLDGFTREDVLKVGRIFRIMENREMFLSLRDNDKELWLRGEMDAFHL